MLRKSLLNDFPILSLLYSTSKYQVRCSGCKLLQLQSNQFKVHRILKEFGNSERLNEGARINLSRNKHFYLQTSVQPRPL